MVSQEEGYAVVGGGGYESREGRLDEGEGYAGVEAGDASVSVEVGEGLEEGGSVAVLVVDYGSLLSWSEVELGQGG